MNIFTQMTKSLSFPAYRIFRSSTGGKNFLYLFTLAVIGYIISVGIGIALPAYSADGIDNLTEELPFFEMSPEGVLTVDLQHDEVTDENQRFILDTTRNYGYDEESKTVYIDNGGVREDVFFTDDYNQSLVIGRNMAFANSEGEAIPLVYSELPLEWLEKINTVFLIKFIKTLFAIFLAVAFIFYIIRLSVWNLVNTAVGAVISSTMGVKNTFGQLYSMSLRAYTIPYLLSNLLLLLGIYIPFKTIIMLIATGFILSKGIKSVKNQLDEEAAQSLNVDSSDLAFRSMYGEQNAFEYTDDNNN